MIKDARGRVQIKQAEENRLLIWNFYETNEGVTQRECADELGLSIVTVNRHVKAIRAGWKPAENVSVS